jgi:hypothetical protein
VNGETSHTAVVRVVRGVCVVETNLVRMGRSKRHFKGNNKSNDKKRRRENEEEWQQKRQDNRDEYVTKPGNDK